MMINELPQTYEGIAETFLKILMIELSLEK